ncbi:hypothetical protein L7F22_066252 [Adiantum nelumboides]|nr:hypothetical protein [Adiantum nelumboides]
MSQPDVVPESLSIKTAVVTGERKKEAEKGPNNDDVPPLKVVEPEPCKPAAVTKEGKKGALKAQQPEQIAMTQGQDAPLLADVPRETCQGAALKKAPKAPKEIQPTKQGLKRATPLKIDAPLSADVPREQGQGVASKKAPKAPKVATPLKIAMPPSQDAPLSMDVPQEQCQGSVLKKAPKAPKEVQPTRHGLKIATPLKIAMPEGQDAPLSTDVPREQGQGATLKKAPKDMIVLEGSSPLKFQKSGQAKKLSGTVVRPTQDTEGTAVPEQQNVKRLKRMKEVEVREAIEQKLGVDEIKVKGHTDKGQLQKVPQVKIALKRDGVKNKAKKHVEKGQEDEGPADKALALVGSSKRPKLQVKRAKQSGQVVLPPQLCGGSDISGGDDNGGGDISGGGDDLSGGSNISGGGDDDGGGDISGGDDDDEDDGTDDEDDGNGSGKGDSESVSEQDGAQDVSSDKDEVQEILSSPASILD